MPGLSAAASPIVVIRPAGGSAWRWRAVWDHRELLYFLVWRDVKIRYKQTALGILWVVLQPLLTMAVFSVVFGRWARLPSSGMPYPVMVYAGLLPWQLMARALTETSQSVVANQQLVTKVYFPRVLIPLASVMGGLVDMVIAVAGGLAVAAVCGMPFSGWLGTLPLWMGLSVLTAFAVSLWLSAMNVRYRDVRYVVPFLLQAWFFLTPVAYAVEVIPPEWHALYALNPLVGLAEGFRSAFIGPSEVLPAFMMISLGVTGFVLWGGLKYFQHAERSFADVL